MVQDGIELAEFLRKSLRKEKIILVGHSWGSILGVFMAKARPDLFYAFVGTGQIADPAKTYAVAYSELLKEQRLSERSGPLTSSAGWVLHRMPMAGGTQSNASGQTYLKEQTSFSRPLSVSH